MQTVHTSFTFVIILRPILNYIFHSFGVAHAILLLEICQFLSLCLTYESVNDKRSTV